MSRQTAPTLDDVARRAQVSTATVSRCLNTPERVSDATRARVLGAVSELGYTPNFGARVMAAKRTQTIGAVIPTMDNAIFARGVQALQEGLHAQGYTLLVASSSYSQRIEAEQVRALVARGADGLLLIGHDREPELTTYLRAQTIPTLVAWAHGTDQSGPAIGFDNEAAMQCLAHEVIGLGHRRIAMISAPVRDNDRARGRLHGVQAAMVAADLRPQDLILVECPYGIESGAQALDQIMAQGAPPTAVICANDVLAVGAVRAAQRRGLRIPEDLSITGFDDMELAQVVTPALTTMRVPHREMGLRAADLLVQMVQDGTFPQIDPLPTELIRRDSLAPPPNG